MPSDSVAVTARAREALANGRFDEAVGLFERAICLDPGGLESYFYAAVAASRQLNMPLALACSRRATMLLPGHAGVRFNYATSLANNLTGPASADQLKRVVAIEPGWGQVYETLANTLLGLAEWPGARRSLSAAERFPELDGNKLAVIRHALEQHRQPKSLGRPTTPPAMVFDCFMFFNELDLLEIRFNELWEKVDRFVLIEATRTHSNKEKPLHYDENKGRFEKFKDKIIHIVLDQYPKYENAMQFDTHQRNQCNHVLEYCRPNDIIMISDLDEIPNPDFITEDLARDGMTVFEQDNHYYFVNYRMTDRAAWRWRGTRAIRARDFTTDAQSIRAAHSRNILRNAGWHFSYLGGIDKIIEKLQAFAHQEFNLAEFRDRATIEQRIRSGEDLFGRSERFEVVDLDARYPRWLRQNQERFRHLIAPTGAASSGRP